MGRISLRGYEDGIQISVGLRAFLRCRLRSKLIGSRSRCSIWRLIHVPALRKSNVPPHPPLSASVRLQPSPHLNPPPAI